MKETRDKKGSERTLSRRGFLKLAGAGGVSGVIGLTGICGAHASGYAAGSAASAMGVLVDTTLCIGCRSCEAACNEVNHLPKPAIAFDDDSVLENIRDTSTTAYTVVNRYTVGKEQITRKQQCMHCLEPACTSACIIKAMEKQSTGPVTYREDLCLGCRYCMVSCPFGVPKFEYEKASPYIKKCQFCFERQKEGKEPACVEACPADALKFGRRADLIEEAKTRIYTKPDAYVHHVYGEHEAGGTSWLYIASVAPEQLGLPNLDARVYPELTSGALGTVPMVMLTVPALLMGIRHLSHRKEDVERENSKPRIYHRGGHDE